LIFRPELAAKVKSGDKTQTRRLLVPYETAKHGEKIVRGARGARVRKQHSTVTVAGRLWLACRYETEHSYAVQPGRGREAIARLRVTDVRHERLGEITAEDARREGFKRKGFGSTAMFEEYWAKLHGEWDPRVHVWVISFELEPEDVRFLAPSHPARPDYTGNRQLALDPDAEVPPAGDVERFADDNAARFAAARGEELSRRELRSSMERLKRLAKSNPTSAAQIITRHVAEIEQELSEQRAA
jgi:hypothetical protein